MLDKIFFAVLIASITGIFRFAATIFDISIGTVSTGLLTANWVYIFGRLKYLKMAWLRMLPWIVLLLVWPLTTLAYSPTVDVRQAGILFNNLSLFVGGAIFSMSIGSAHLSRLFLISLLLTAFGVVLNMFAPDTFIAVALLADANHFSMNRPGGFFLQPNELALGICFMFTGWLIFTRHNTVLFVPIAMVLFLALIVLAGSRLGILIALLIIVLYLLHHQPGELSRFKITLHPVIRLTAFVAFLFIGIVSMKSFLVIYSQNVASVPGGGIDRMANFLDFRLTQQQTDLLQTDSAMERRAAQMEFWKMIGEEPFFGHGFGSIAHYLNNGRLYKTAHSTAISTFMAYGVFYPIFFFSLLVLQYFSPKRRKVEMALNTNSIQIFLIVAFTLFVFSGGLLHDRTFLVLLGAVIGVLNFPTYIFSRPSQGTCKLQDHPRVRLRHPPTSGNPEIDRWEVKEK